MAAGENFSVNFPGCHHYYATQPPLPPVLPSHSLLLGSSHSSAPVVQETVPVSH